MIVVPDEGAIELLNKTLRAALAVGENYSLRLYRNDYTPVAASTLASFTEATFAGYFRHDLLRSSWGAPAIVSGKAVTEYAGAELSWIPTETGQVIYGYYVVAPATAKVAWAERFGTPRTMNAGGKFILTARFSGRSDV